MATDVTRLPVMPVREMVVFPDMLVPFVIGRPAGVSAIQETIAGSKKLLLVAQRDASVAEPGPNDLFTVGTIVNVVQSMKLPDGNLKVLVEGLERARILSLSDDDGFLRATFETLGSKLDPTLRNAYGVDEGSEIDTLIARVERAYGRISRQAVDAGRQFPAFPSDEPGKIADRVGALIPLTLEEKQQFLEIFDPVERLTRLAEILESQLLPEAPDKAIQLLRHTVATLAYRAGKAMRGVPPEFATYQSAPDSRTPAEILAHMGDLFDWALLMCDGLHRWHDSPPLPWDEGMARFFAALEAFDRRLDSGKPLGFPPEKIFQGPIADALTHVGQIAMLRRLAGHKMRGENYFRADIRTGSVGPVQAPPVLEFD